MIDLSFSNEMPDVGETIELTVSLEAVNAEALRTGVFLFTDEQGEFVLVEPETTRFVENSTTAVLHSEPRNLDDQNKAQFQFAWVAPAEPGVANFTVWSMTGNTNGLSDDDQHSTRNFSIAHGCEGRYYYPDVDQDGFGNEQAGVLSCEPIENFVEQGGDCNDEEATVNPTEEETCNSRDDNCDGASDEGLEPGLYYPDPDGDGYAADGEIPQFTCNDAEGFTAELGDCEPDDPDVYPGAPELDNGRDDNCNGEIDEDGPEEGSDTGGTSGSPSDESGSGPAVGSSLGADESDSDSSSGCSVAARSNPGAWASMWLWLVVTGAGVRSRSRHARR